MALKDLSVDEFVFEILHSMKVPPFKPNTRTQIGFYGKSSKFPMRVRGNELMDKVYKKICSIEEQRERSKQNSSTEELPKSASQVSKESGSKAIGVVADKIRSRETIVAEIDLTVVESLQGNAERKYSERKRKSRNTRNRSLEQDRHVHSKSKTEESNDSQTSSCVIF